LQLPLGVTLLSGFHGDADGHQDTHAAVHRHADPYTDTDRDSHAHGHRHAYGDPHHSGHRNANIDSGPAHSDPASPNGHSHAATSHANDGAQLGVRVLGE